MRPGEPTNRVSHHDAPHVVKTASRRTLCKPGLMALPIGHVESDTRDQHPVEPAFQHGRLPVPPGWIDEYQRVAPKHGIGMRLHGIRIAVSIFVFPPFGLAQQWIEAFAVKIDQPDFGVGFFQLIDDLGLDCRRKSCPDRGGNKRQGPSFTAPPFPCRHGSGKPRAARRWPGSYCRVPDIWILPLGSPDSAASG